METFGETFGVAFGILMACVAVVAVVMTAFFVFDVIVHLSETAVIPLASAMGI